MFIPVQIEPETLQKTWRGKLQNCFIVEISGEEYEICDRVSQGDNYWANSKRGQYGAGAGRTEEDKYKPVRTGLLGQMAFGKTFNRPVDIVYRKGGDKYDNLIGPYRYDMKCRMKDKGEGLTLHTSEEGRRIPLDKDIYVFCYIDSEDREKRCAVVVMVGFMLKGDVEKCKVAKGTGKWLNYVVPYNLLQPIDFLLKMVKKHYPV